MAEGRLVTGYAIVAGPLESFANAAIFPAETEAIAGAGSRRWAAFRGGRACARAALRELGLPPIAIPADTSGAPVWPDAFIGSITHTNEIAATVVAHRPPVSGLGLDLETDEPLDDATMVRIVCRPEELVPDCDPSHPANLQRGKLLFVVKEAVYKLYRSLHDTFLDFQDLSVSLDEGAGAFRAALVDPRLPAVAGGRSITGRFTHAEGLFIALAVQDRAGRGDC